MCRRGLQETTVSSKAVPEVLDMKCRSEFEHGLQCAILKAVNCFQGNKSPEVKGFAIFSLKYSK